MNIAEQPQTLTVMEGGFKILPGREEEFWNMYEKMLPLAMSQDGFNAAYGGPILNSEWLYFGARFNNWGDMERWYRENS